MLVLGAAGLLGPSVARELAAAGFAARPALQAVNSFMVIMHDPGPCVRDSNPYSKYTGLRTNDFTVLYG